MSETSDVKRAKVRRIVDELAGELQRDVDVLDDDIVVLDEYVGPGYGVPTPAGVAATERLARAEGRSPRRLLESGGWSLAPAYDVTYSYQPQGRWTSSHQMSLAGKRDGFTREDLVITVDDSQLAVRGKQGEAEDRVYLHRGIAARQFQRSFVLADGIEVTGAELSNGLLHIDLVRPQPESRERVIEIQTADRQNEANVHALDVGSTKGSSQRAD